MYKSTRISRKISDGHLKQPIQVKVSILQQHLSIGQLVIKLIDDAKTKQVNACEAANLLNDCE